MRIVIPTWSLSAKHGGVRVLCELASGLTRRGHQVTLLAFDEEAEPAFPTEAAIERIGPVPRGRHLVRDLPKQWGLRRALARHADADAMLANQHLTVWPVHATPTRARKVYYIQAYEPDFYDPTPLYAVHRRIAMRSYRYPLRHVANSPSVARAVHGDRAAAVPIVPPGVDPALYHADGRHPPGARLRVGTIGRAEHWKGTADCFEAVRRARAEGVALDFSVAFGNIPPAHADAPREDVHPRNDRELTDWYRSLDILIAAVYWGGAPYPPVEAMACGAAVVSTPNDHVRDGVDALTAPQQDPAALAAALVRMARDAALRSRLVEAGLRASAAHHWPRVVERMEGILTGAIPAPRGMEGTA